MLLFPNHIESNAVAAIDNYNNEMTYGELIEFGKELFYAVENRSLIFILSDNSIGALSGYIGCINNKIVPLLLNSNLDNSFLLELIKIYKPRFIWAPGDFESEFNEGSVFERFGFKLYKTGLENEEMHQDLALLLTTSGSTGTPKLVRHSYENIIESSKNVSELFDLSARDRGLLILPMNYTMGLSVINSHLYVGGIVLLTDKNLGDRELWQFIKSSRATNLTGVPFNFEFMFKIGFMEMDLPDLRFLAQGGGKLALNLFEAYARYALDSNKQFIATYGQTEGTARMSFLPSNMALKKIGSIGRGMPNGKLGIIDDCNELQNNNNIKGELVYFGKNVTMGYSLKSTDLKKGDENNGYLITGDMAFRDEDGYYFIIGRKNRFVKIFGERISLDHLEQTIASNFNLKCICLGNDTKIRVLLDNMRLRQDVSQFLNQKVHIKNCSFTIEALTELKRNDFGKVMYTQKS